MGWSHPDVSLEDMVKLIKGFVDILILASGYQSSGHFVHWAPQNIKRAFQWGIFFENVNMAVSFCVLLSFLLLNSCKYRLPLQRGVDFFVLLNVAMGLYFWHMELF